MGDSFGETDMEMNSDDLITLTITAMPRKAGVSLLQHYFSSVKRIAAAITRVKGVYTLTPYRVATGTTSDDVSALLTSVFGFHVKFVLKNCELYIVNLSVGLPHGRGVAHLIGQATQMGRNEDGCYYWWHYRY